MLHGHKALKTHLAPKVSSGTGGTSWLVVSGQQLLHEDRFTSNIVDSLVYV